MRLIPCTKEELLATVIERFIEYHGCASDSIRALQQIRDGGRAITREDVLRVFNGRTGWIKPSYCDEPDCKNPAVLVIGEDDTDDARGCDLCADCLKKAYALVFPEPKEK